MGKLGTYDYNRTSPTKRRPLTATDHPIGDRRDSFPEIKTEDSDIDDLNAVFRHPRKDQAPNFVDVDFKYLRKILSFPKTAWLTEVRTNLLKIYRKKNLSVESNFMVKVIITLPGIEKQIAFRAI